MAATSVCMTPKAPRQNVPRPPYIGVLLWTRSAAEKMSVGSMTYMPSSRRRWTLRCTAGWFHMAVFMAGAMITGAVVAATVSEISAGAGSETLAAGGRGRHHQEAIGRLSQGDVRHVDVILALKGVDPRADAIAFEEVPGGKMQRGLRQDQIDLAVETRITQAHDHRCHQAGENTAGQPNHQVGACRLPPCDIVALIVGEDPLTARLELHRCWGLKNNALL